MVRNNLLLKNAPGLELPSVVWGQIMSLKVNGRDIFNSVDGYKFDFYLQPEQI